jgi:hypothetical protein
MKRQQLPLMSPSEYFKINSDASKNIFFAASKLKEFFPKKTQK